MKRILPLLMACLLMPAGCGMLPKDGGAPTRIALAEPVYPEFPKEPDMPMDGGEKEWDAYMEDYERYIDALEAVRGGESNVPQAEEEILRAFAAKSTALALAGREGENTVYSPLSLWSALALLGQCAGGDSREQVLKAVGADNIDTLQEQVFHIWRTLYTDDGRSSLILANSIWLNSNMKGTYIQDTLDTLAVKYYAGAYSVPMGTGGADQAVTEWVRKQTNGLIGGDGPVFQTREETLALLVSSLYYKAAWQNEFMPERTEIDTFTDAAGQETQVDFMHKTQDASFLRREDWQAASLSTHLGEMVFVLPDEGVTPESLLQNPDFLSGLNFLEENIWGEVRWSVPKFDVSSDLDLKDTLSALGITDLLDPDRADLSALTDLDAFLSDATQLARVKVDEEGVEAAAVTMMAPGAGMPPEDPEICVMDLDRPFLFVIRTQNVPLFIGVVNQVQA